MKNLILEIRNRLNASQEDLARMIGISYATVNRWENGHSQPNKAAQLRLYDICKERNIDLEDIIQQGYIVSRLEIWHQRSHCSHKQRAL